MNRSLNGGPPTTNRSPEKSQLSDYYLEPSDDFEHSNKKAKSYRMKLLNKIHKVNYKFDVDKKSSPYDGLFNL